MRALVAVLALASTIAGSGVIAWCAAVDDRMRRRSGRWREDRGQILAVGCVAFVVGVWALTILAVTT